MHGGPDGRDGAWSDPDGAPPPHHRLAEMLFRHADTDGDGRVSLAEAEAAALARFDRLDTNHDGRLSDEERAAAWQHPRGPQPQRWDAGPDMSDGMAPPPPYADAPPPQGTILR
jgi:hypothetical protein